MTCEQKVPPSEDELWHVIGSYFDRFGVARHQLESFDNFMTTSLPHIVQESSEICLRSGTAMHTVSLCNVGVQRPVLQESDGYDRQLAPHMARLRSETYAATVMVDVVHDIFEKEVHQERRVFRQIQLCKLPVMLGSMYCHTYKSERKYECRLDQGGYFIINGIEKVLLAQVASFAFPPDSFTLAPHVTTPCRKSCTRTKRTSSTSNHHRNISWCAKSDRVMS